MSSNPLGGRLDNGSSSQGIDQVDIPHVGKSYFDLSRIHSTTVDVGGIYPMDLLKVVLGDEISLSSVLYVDSSNPLVKPLMSRVRCYVKYFYSRSTDLWKGYQNFITTGRRASASLSLPYLTLSQGYVYRNNNVAHFPNGYTDVGTETDSPLRRAVFSGPMCLGSYFQLPFGRYIDSVTTSLDSARLWFAPYGNFPTAYKFAPFLPDSVAPIGFSAKDNIVSSGGTFESTSLFSSLKLNALPFVMYQRIYRDYFLNKNLTQNNKNWFPDSEDDFILPYDTTQAYSVLNQNTYRYRYEIVPNNSTDSTYWDDSTLPALRFCQWRGDYFTEALPWQYRGDEPAVTQSNSVRILGDNGLYQSVRFRPDGHGSFETNVDGPEQFSSETNYSASVTSSLTANNVRELFTLASFRERMAKTNGDYNELMRSQFGLSPNLHDRKPHYIGGFELDLNASQIESTVSTSDEPLGSTAGRLSGLGHGSLGKFHVPDNGYIMAVLHIVPDVVYANQGIPRHLRGATSMSEEYFPLFNNLAPQGITTSEIYAGVTNSEQFLFGWIDRFMDYKTRQNYVSGLLALPASWDSFFSSRVWTRRFNLQPFLTNAFVTCAPPTIDRSLFSSPTDPAFIVQFASKVDAVRPIPFKSQPASLNGFAM